MKKIYILALLSFVIGIVVGAMGLGRLRVAAINSRSESNKNVFGNPVSRMIIEEFPTLRITSVDNQVQWSLMFMGKEAARNQEDSLKEISKYSGWAKEFDQDWAVIIDPSPDIAVSDLKSVITALHRNGFDRVWIAGIAYGTITPD